MGSSAAGSLSPGARGEVAARFDHSLYLESANGHFVCMLPASAPDGPLHLRMRGDWAALRGACAPGTAWRADQAELQIGTVQIALAGARAWPCPRLPRVAHARITWRSFGTTLAGRSPALDTVLGIPHRGHSGPPQEALRGLTGWLQDPSGIDADLDAAVGVLVGLGPGLTPAADDLLAGVALVLNASRGPHLRAFRVSVAARLHATHPISAAHLREALQGRASAPAHAALEALLQGEDAQRLAAHCRRLGHTSGWDMLAGMLLAVAAGTRLQRSLAAQASGS